MSRWPEVLEAYAATLQEYTQSVDDIALRSYPRERNIYAPALLAAAQELDAARAVFRGGEPLPLGGLEGTALARVAFDLYDSLEQARHSLDRGTRAALYADLLHTAANRMGRTPSDSLRRLANRLGARHDEAEATSREVSAALEPQFAPLIANGASSAQVAGVYASAPGRSVPSAGLYAAVLGRFMQAGESQERLLQLIDGAAEEALGGRPDTRDAIDADAKARAHYHPIQAMGMTFGLFPAAFGAHPGERPKGGGGGQKAPRGGQKAPRDGLGAALLLDCTLPQAHAAVDYDIAPLMDLQTAASYGPLPVDVSGLNFKLVQRLKTIRETPIPPRRQAGEPAEATIRPPEAALGPQAIRQAFQTVDGGRTYRRLDRDGGMPRDIDRVRAGPRGRVARYAELLHEGLRAAPAAQLPYEKPEELLDRYKQDRDGLSESLAPSPERLLQALEAQFLAARAAAPPADQDEFGKLLQSRAYVVKAVSRVLGDTALGAISRAALRRASSSSPVAPPGVTQTEVLLTLTAQAGRIAETLEGRIRGAYTAVAKKGPWRAGRAGQADQLALFRDVARVAVGQKEGIVVKTATIAPQATLKLFVLG